MWSAEANGSGESERGAEDSFSPQEVDPMPYELFSDPYSPFIDEEIIDCVRAHPLLWNTELCQYKDGIQKTRVWNQIAEQLKKPVNEIKRRWKNLRDGMVKSIRKNNFYPNKPVHKCRFYDKLTFLQSIYINRLPPIKIPFPCPPNLKSILNRSDPLSLQSPEYLGASHNTPPPPTANGVSRKRKTAPESLVPPGISIQDASALEGGSGPAAKRVNAMDYCEVVEEPEHFLPEEEEEGGGGLQRSSNWYFCQSLVESLDALPPKKNRMAKIKIQELLMNLEFE